MARVSDCTDWRFDTTGWHEERNGITTASSLHGLLQNIKFGGNDRSSALFTPLYLQTTTESYSLLSQTVISPICFFS